MISIDFSVINNFKKNKHNNSISFIKKSHRELRREKNVNKN